ncbi:substrate-binding domain-containing protein [Pseudonocardia xinjiangensis]|uniref:Substrate-binding domain-containing protein n=1 Tax=Pseudonocardia xinjiangensis TaxID=75289 RepID=A0ABX1RNC3_9PSEU|nr:LacI family DNA-binding transcriptional regulator [Pseudonocardia xinjiangensis]NMH81134.1 substrate-binding domain-containing protein [Pseudonocardia xinjiangensis]
MHDSAPAPVMTDVARLAGVSHQTVSRVVNGSPHVSTPTRNKVLAAMEQLGYRRNAVARALATRRSGTLGVITFDTVLHGPVTTLYGVEQAAGALGLGVSIAVVDRVSSDAVMRALTRLEDQSVEGVIALATQEDAVRALTAGLRALPAIFVGGLAGAAAAGATAVGTDQLDGAQAATRHLLEFGHRTVHHLAGPQDWLDSRWRVEGWRAALHAAGAPEPPLVEGDWSARSGYCGMRAMLAADPALTAVFAANDQMALGALRALDEAGRRVPEDVSVVGFDDVPEAEFFRPPLTTVRQHFAEAGQRAVHLLLDLIRPQESPADATPPPLVPTELVVRRSSGPAAR